MNESITQSNPFDNGYSVEKLVYSNGHEHLYLRDLETDKLVPTSWEAVAQSYGRELGHPVLNGSKEHSAPETQSQDLTDQERLRIQADWQQRVDTTDKKPSERGLTGEDLAYNAWLKENAAAESSSPTLRQKIKDEAEQARIDSMREFARLEMRVKTGAASGEDTAYYYTLKENQEKANNQNAATEPQPKVVESATDDEPKPVDSVVEAVQPAESLAEEAPAAENSAKSDKSDALRRAAEDRTVKLHNELLELAADGSISALDYNKKLTEYETAYCTALARNGVTGKDEKAYIDRLVNNVDDLLNLYKNSSSLFSDASPADHERADQTNASEQLNNILNETVTIDSEEQAKVDAANEALVAAMEAVAHAKSDGNIVAEHDAKSALYDAFASRAELADWDGNMRDHVLNLVDSVIEDTSPVEKAQVHTDVINHASEEQEEIQFAYEDELDHRRAALIRANRASDTADRDETLNLMHRMILNRAQALGQNKDWIKQEVKTQTYLVSQQLKQSNQKYARIRAWNRDRKEDKAVDAYFASKFANPDGSPEGQPQEKRRTGRVVMAAGAIALVAIGATSMLVNALNDDTSDKPKVNVPAATTPTTAERSIASTAPKVGAENAPSVTVKLAQDKTVSHIALDRLYAQGTLSPDMQQRLTQIQAETQRILDLNNMSWDQARHINTGTDIKV